MLSDERRNFGKILPAVTARPYLDDQAAALRAPDAPRARGARVLAVTGGKGGVGKTNVAVNLSIALSQLGRRVTLVDLDLGLANADLLMDITPKYNLATVVTGRRRISEVLVRTPYGPMLVPGASGIEKLANLIDEDRGALISALEALCEASDFILFDTAAGISKNTTDFAAAADEVLVVTAPEPPAVVDAYAMIKMISAQEDAAEIGVIVNMAATPEEGERFAQGIATTAYRMLQTYVEKRGVIPSDRHVPAAVRARRPFTVAYPNAPATTAVRAIARRLCTVDASAPTDERPGFLRRALRALWGR